MVLRDVLAAYGMTGADLSRASGISETQISHFVTGRRMPSLGNLVRLADALKCSTDLILGRAVGPVTPMTPIEEMPDAVLVRELSRRLQVG